jgi:hypothetical protein
VIGYLCGITSERKVVEELRMHLAVVDQSEIQAERLPTWATHLACR